MMRKIFMILGVAGSLLLQQCSRNAISGRRQASLVSEAELQQMALQEYRTFLTQSKVVSAGANRDAEMVRRIGTRIARAVTDYYTAQGKGEIFNGYQWEFNLVESNEVNAWCMPGGKVVVYTGLLPVTKNEAALAVVMGHEIAHALLTHGNERVSQSMYAQLGQAAGNIALSKNQQAVNIFNAAYGVGAQVGVLLPFSRKQESEADEFGLYFSAMAGYNPREAIPLWERMAALSKSAGTKPPEWLSTHPAESTRIQRLNQHMPKALEYYKPMGN